MEVIIQICLALIKLHLDIVSCLDPPQFHRDVKNLGSINRDSEGPGPVRKGYRSWACTLVKRYYLAV